MRILLASNTTQHGLGALQHLQPVMAQLFDGRSSVLFIGWAKENGDGYATAVRPAFDALGLELICAHQGAALDDADGIFVGGGNTFLLTHRMYEHDWMDQVRVRVMAGMPYLGTSAGSNLACPTLCTTNDMPIVRPKSFATLGVVPFQINAHYVDPDPQSIHQGETRAERIAEYHQHNALPVVGLREGSWLSLTRRRLVLDGVAGGGTGCLFRRGWQPEELERGRDLTVLLQGQ